MTDRPGATSVAELVLVFWLFTFVLAGLARFAAAQGRAAAVQEDRIRAQEAVRTARVILGRELRHLAAVDVREASADSISLRAVRGSGPVCSVDGPTAILGYRGVRRPDPAKDSLVLVDGNGIEDVIRIVKVSSASDPCPGTPLRLTLEVEPTARGAFGLVFEPGVYAVSDHALRYRSGAGGRQPLTEAIITRVGLLSSRGSGLGMTMETRADSLPRLQGERFAVHLPLLNRQP